MTTTTPTRGERVRERIAALRAARNDLERELAAITAHPDYSDAYKQRLIAEARERFAATAKAQASVAWRDGQTVLAALDAEMRLAAQAEARDPARVQLATAELQARLSAAGDSFGQQSQLDALRDFERLARLRGDEDALHALRIVALPLADELRRSGDDGADFVGRLEAHDRQLREQLLLLESERAWLQGYELQELRSAILATEDAATGRQRSPWSPPSSWQLDVLGESTESLGGGVHWRDAND